MADDGTISIKIAGEVDSSLTASTSAAKSSLADLTAAGNAAADALDGSLKEGFLASALAATRMAGAVAGLGEKLNSGNFFGAASDIAGIAASFAELGPAALGPAAAIGAVAGGLGYLISQSLVAQKNMDDLTEGFALTGRGASMSAESVSYELGFLSELPGSNSKAAESFLQLSAQHAGWSSQLVDSLGQLLPAFIRGYGDEAPQAAGRLIGALSDLSEDGFEKLNRQMLGLNPTEFEAIQHLIQIGDTAGATSRILADLSKDSGVYIKSLGDKVYDELQKIAQIKSEMNRYFSHDAVNPALVQQLQQEENALAAIRDEERKVDQTGRNDAYTSQLVAVQKIGQQLDTNVDKLQKQMTDAKAFGTQAQSRSDATGMGAAAKAEAAIQQNLNEEIYRSYVARQDAMAAAAKSGSAARVVAAQNEVNEAKQLFGDQSNQYLEALAKLNAAARDSSQQGARATSAAEKAGSQEAIAAARDAASEIIANDRMSSERKLADAEVEWDQLLAGDKLNARQRADAAREEADDKREIKKQAVRDEEEIDRGAVNTQLQLRKIATEGEKASLELSVGYNQSTAAQKLAIQKAFYDTEIQQQVDTLEFDMEGMDADAKAYRDKENQISILRAQRAQKDIQYSLQESKAEIEQWRTADQAIESAESQLVSDIFSKRQGLGADLRAIALKELEEEIQDDLKALTEHELVNLQMLSSDQATAKAGALAHLAEWGAQQMGLGGSGINPVTVTPSVLGQGGSAAGAVGQAGQQAAITSNTAALTALTSALTAHGALLGTNTAATATDTAATATNATTTGAHAAVMGANVATTSANVAATTVNASMTGVSAAATTAHATVMGANTIATIANTIATWAESIADLMPFASGSDNIPFDMPAFIHKGEMIVPAEVAAQVRAGNMNIGNLADLAAMNDLTPVDIGNSPLSPGGGRAPLSSGFGDAASRGDTGNFARGGDTYNNMGGLHIHGFDLPSIAHNPAFQREAMKIVRNIHRNAARR